MRKAATPAPSSRVATFDEWLAEPSPPDVAAAERIRAFLDRFDGEADVTTDDLRLLDAMGKVLNDGIHESRAKVVSLIHAALSAKQAAPQILEGLRSRYPAFEKVNLAREDIRDIEGRKASLEHAYGVAGLLATLAGPDALDCPRRTRADRDFAECVRLATIKIKKSKLFRAKRNRRRRR